MQAATIHELKKELAQLEPSKLMALCLRLASFKKENKELLSYLLFESESEQRFIENVKHEIDTLFETLNHSRIFFIKKGLRKTLRFMDKNIRYSKNKETETDLRIYFCKKIIASKIPLNRSKVLNNIYSGQIKKIKAAISKLHEDLQYDYGLEVEKIVRPKI